MKYLLIKLSPRSSLHLGQREQWLEGSRTYIPSDTIFSALCHCHLLLYGEVESLLAEFKDGDPPFLLSSVFPRWGDDLYFPLPKNQLAADKDLKKLKFVNQTLLFRLLSGEKLQDLKDELEINHELKCLPLIKKERNVDEAEDQKKSRALSQELDLDDRCWQLEDIPRVALNRLNNHPGENFFHFGQVTYAQDAGLFILVEVRNEKWQQKIEALFRLMCDEGIGGDRTCGKGLFRQPVFLDFEPLHIAEPNAAYSLSAYFPRPEEIAGLDESFYELEERKGYIFSPLNRSLRRRSIRVFTEGCVFSHKGQRIGRLENIAPDIFNAHPVYRYGFLFSFPCKLEET